MTRSPRTYAENPPHRARNAHPSTCPPSSRASFSPLSIAQGRDHKKHDQLEGVAPSSLAFSASRVFRAGAPGSGSGPGACCLMTRERTVRSFSTNWHSTANSSLPIVPSWRRLSSASTASCLRPMTTAILESAVRRISTSPRANGKSSVVSLTVEVSLRSQGYLQRDQCAAACGGSALRQMPLAFAGRLGYKRCPFDTSRGGWAASTNKGRLSNGSSLYWTLT